MIPECDTLGGGNLPTNMADLRSLQGAAVHQ